MQEQEQKRELTLSEKRRAAAMQVKNHRGGRKPLPKGTTKRAQSTSISIPKSVRDRIVELARLKKTSIVAMVEALVGLGEASIIRDRPTRR